MTNSTRKLAAIMFTDIIGYTALMGKDEQRALEILDKNRDIQKPFIKKHGGRYVKEIGDGILAIFPTASKAVFCAKEIQQQLKDDPTLKVRIGIHLGEIVVSHKDVLGDGVNIASRIENIAPSQGIYISETVFHEIRNIREIDTCYQGEIKFKNTESKIRIYAIMLDFVSVPGKAYFRKKKEEIIREAGHRKIIKWISAILFFILILLVLYKFEFSSTTGISPEWDKDKTVMVLPFENIGNDDANAYISIGITEDILNQLLKIRDLKVIDRSNLRKYEYQNKTFKDIGKELNVSNLLIGSVRKDADRIRITARLINAKTEEVVWTNVYNKSFEDIFTIQTEVAISIAEALKAEVTADEVKKIGKRPTLNMTAYDLYLKGKEYYSRYTEQDNISAMELFNEALRLDPEFTLAHAGLSDAFSQLAQKSKAKDLWLDSAYRHARIVQQEEPDNSSGYKSMGLYYSINGNTLKAMQEFQKAVDIDKNIEAVINLSRLYYRTGQLDKALILLSDAQWHDPMNTDLWFSFAATYYRLNNMPKASEYLEKALIINPNHVNSLLLKWLISVIVYDTETSFSVSQKLGFIGNDDSDKLLMLLQRLIQEEITNTIKTSSFILDLMKGREIDYADLPYIYNLIGYIYYIGNMTGIADELFSYKLTYNTDRIARGEMSYKFRYEIAQIYAVKGDKKNAYKWLEEAFEAGWTEYSYAAVDPLFNSLRQDERFEKLIEKARDRVNSMQSHSGTGFSKS